MQARLGTRGWVLFMALPAFAPLPAARADIPADRVLVVYNLASPDAVALKDDYLAAHPDIPPENVLALNSVSLLAADLPYPFFLSLVRNPIRNYLLQPGSPEPADIVAIVLIRPFPHRVQDTNAVTAGDSPSTALGQFFNGDANYCSVDSELTLLWQDLDSGEAGGTMDSRSDNVIANPYFKSSDEIDSYVRTNITVQRTLTNVQDVAWLLDNSGLTPGDMLIVARIDGSTLDDARAALQRAQDLYVNRAASIVVLDSYDTNLRPPLDDDSFFSPPEDDPFWGGPDYDDTDFAMSMAGWMVRRDQSFTFVSPALEPRPIMAYASYGGNHSLGGAGEPPPGGSLYMLGFRFPPGAIFNTIESYNGRAFNLLGTMFNQGQVSGFIAAGGTFGIGHVWEPFSPLVSDNEFVLKNFLLAGRTWGESAWSSIPGLSWQQIVVGDPMARATVIYDPGLPRGDMNGDGLVNGDDVQLFQLVLAGRIAAYRASYPALDPIFRGDFTGDYRVDASDIPGFLAALLGL